MLHCCFKSMTSDLKFTKFSPPQYFSGYALGNVARLTIENVTTFKYLGTVIHYKPVDVGRGGLTVCGALG